MASALAPRPDPVTAPASDPARTGTAAFRPSATTQLAPSGAAARVRANLEAVRLLRDLQATARPATPDEQAVLAAWSGWGAVPAVFDPDHEEFSWARTALDDLLGAGERVAAQRNILNAHYTDPALVAPIWEALTRLGFDGGRVLEPGCGSGNFIGMAPPGAQMVGVELEPVTAGIAAALYPNATILTESFADTRAPRGSFDLVVGNVPFAKAALTDAEFNPGKHSIHNHFIIKSLQLVAPGGLVAVITSRYTLDSANPGAHREMAVLADLLGAVRLPSSAHLRTAGTQVVTDPLVLRRREDDFEAAPFDWELTELVDLDHTRTADSGEISERASVRVNSYFTRHPEMVCGQLVAGRGQFSDTELTVRTDQPAHQLLSARLDTLIERARAAELTHRPCALVAPVRRAALVGRAARLSEGHLAADGDGFTTVTDGAVEQFAVPGTQCEELRALLGLRDTVVSLLEAEAASIESTPEIERLRATLNTDYDRYLQAYGPINRFSWRRTGRIHPETGEPVMARVPPRQGGFRADPHAPLVYALEEFDSSTQLATKAAILSQRVVAPRTPRLGADTPADALTICMDTHGPVELAEIARLLGVAEPDARAVLGTLVFEDPAHYLDCTWRPADLEQRDGRALRQGNQNPEIGLYRYVVEGSFDAYSWQTVARKAAFIAQVMRGTFDVREIEDVGDSTLSFNEVKALAAGNPLLMDKAKADADLTRLERLERSHTQAQIRLRYSLTQHHNQIERVTEQIATLQAAISARSDTRGDLFGMSVDGPHFIDRAEAGEALRAWLQDGLHRHGPSPITIPRVTSLGGHTFDATLWRGADRRAYELTVTGIPDAWVEGTPLSLAGAKPAALAIRLENRLTGLDRLLVSARDTLRCSQNQIARTEIELQRPFAYAHHLAAARETTAELARQLTELAAPTEPAPDPTNADPANADPEHTQQRSPNPARGGALSARGEAEAHPVAAARAVLQPSRAGEDPARGPSSAPGLPSERTAVSAVLRRPAGPTPDHRASRAR